MEIVTAEIVYHVESQFLRISVHELPNDRHRVGQQRVLRGGAMVDGRRLGAVQLVQRTVDVNERDEMQFHRLDVLDLQTA